jgi:hypothetical protein
MGGDVEPGRYCLGNPGPMAPKDPGAKAASPKAVTLETLAPTISESVALYGVPPTPGTSVANIAAGHRWMPRANKIQLLSSGHRIL